MKMNWKHILSLGLAVGCLAVSNMALALTPGYYVRMEGDKLLGQLMVFSQKGTLCYGDKCSKTTLKFLTINNMAEADHEFSLNAEYVDLDKTTAGLGKAMMYYGDSFSAYNGQQLDVVSRFTGKDEDKDFTIVETEAGALEVIANTEASRHFSLAGTYRKEETFLQAPKPLVVLAIERIAALPESVQDRSYVITKEGIGYKLTAKEHGDKLADFSVRVDLSKIIDYQVQAQNPKPRVLFVSDYVRKWEAEQEKKAKG